MVPCISKDVTMGMEGWIILKLSNKSPSASPISLILMEPWRARQMPSSFSFLAVSSISSFSVLYKMGSHSPLGTALAMRVGTTSILLESKVSIIPVMESSLLVSISSSPLITLTSQLLVIMGLKVSLSWWRPPTSTLIVFYPLSPLLYPVKYGQSGTLPDEAFLPYRYGLVSTSFLIPLPLEDIRDTLWLSPCLSNM